MKYEEAHIEDLLSRFMKGETTLEEERRLADYFASAPSIPHRWRAFAVLFVGIEAGALDSVDAAPPVAPKCRRHVWLKVAGVAAMLCLCYVLGSVVWQDDAPAIAESDAVATAVEQPVRPSDHPSAAPSAPLNAAPSPAIPPRTPSRPAHRRALARHTAEASQEPEHAPLAQNEPQIEKRPEPQPAPSADAVPDNSSTDLTDHIVSAAFTYSEHSQLDERAIRGRDRVRARVMEQYAHLGL